ncbi:hypothetical protein [Streptomyces sp. NPDC093109]|uniref:hypothetical protein n=1 Tax=Streptomyces sp. NPDC093109 TaxID=3154977 RepID=UPI00344B5F06
MNGWTRRTAWELAAVYALAAAVHVTAVISVLLWNGWLLLHFVPACVGALVGARCVHRAIRPPASVAGTGAGADREVADAGERPRSAAGVQ